MKMAFSPLFLFATFFASIATADFSYDTSASNGPAEWSTLNLGPNVTNQCGGLMNSPIAINTSSCDSTASYVFQSGNCSIGNLKVVLKSNAVQMDYPNASVCAVGTAQIPGIDGTYALKQFHIHASSEHQINGGYFGAELHMVHQLLGSTLLSVVGIPIQPDSITDNPIFASILSAWKQEYLKVLKACNISSTDLMLSGTRRQLTAPLRKLQSDSFNAYNMIPSESSFYTYNGSLTTPPCTQNVWWNVVDTPMLVSVRQFEALSLVLLGYRNVTTCKIGSIAAPSGSTSRPVQPLNGRSVLRVCPSKNINLAATSVASAATTMLTGTTFMGTMVLLMLAMIM